MTRSALLCLSLALGTGCAYSVGAPSARRERPAPSAPVRVIATAQRVPANEGARDLLDEEALGAVLRERLQAGGVREVLSPADGDPRAPQVSLWALGSRNTAVTRALGLPWGLVWLATLGLVPVRGEREYWVELRVVDRSAPAERRVRISRQRYLETVWMWTPLALAGRAGSDRERQRAVHLEGLARAIDAALDEAAWSPERDEKSPASRTKLAGHRW